MKATPYLRRWIAGPTEWRLPGINTTGMRPPIPKAIDIGCGDGRNSDHLVRCGFSVRALDMRPDYRHAEFVPWMAGRDPIPAGNDEFDLVLCQYLLMFLSDDEIYHLLLEIERVLKPEGFVIVELQKVKSGRDVELSRVVDFFLKDVHLTRRQQGKRGDWKVFHMMRDRCVLRYVRPSLVNTVTFRF